MAVDRAIFQDEQGRGWLVEVQYGHPAPTERGIFAARFVCPEDPHEPVRLGYVWQEMLDTQDEEALRMSLHEAEPARPID